MRLPEYQPPIKPHSRTHLRIVPRFEKNATQPGAEVFFAHHIFQSLKTIFEFIAEPFFSNVRSKEPIPLRTLRSARAKYAAFRRSPRVSPIRITHITVARVLRCMGAASNAPRCAISLSHNPDIASAARRRDSPDQLSTAA